MDRIEIMERKPQWDNQQQGPQIRKPNFRKNPNTNKSREGPLDQQIRPPFQENYVENSHQNEEDEDTQINLMGINDGNTIFLTQEEQELCMLQQLKLQSGESFDYKQGYEFAINEVHKQYNLRSKKKTKAPTNKTVQTQTKKTVGAPATKVLQILSRESEKAFTPKIAASPKIVEIIDTAVKTSTDIQKSVAFKTSKYVQKSIDTQVSNAI